VLATLPSTATIVSLDWICHQHPSGLNTPLAPSSPIRPSKSLFDMAINSAHRAHR